jgi:hypothetical protein
MPTTLAKTRPTMLAASLRELACVCLFSLLGLTLSAAVLSNVSTETISMMFSSLG